MNDRIYTSRFERPLTIKKTLARTKEATYCIYLPIQGGGATPTGTGFFVSPDGWFVTAAHVVTEDGTPNGTVRSDIGQAFLMKEPASKVEPWMRMLQLVSFEYVHPETDFALLKVDFAPNAKKDTLKGKTEFDFIEVSTRELDEGEPVYSFGYPLPRLVLSTPNVSVSELCPRVTSAIVASTFEKAGGVMSPQDPLIYVLDKALNYGNSGGPIVSEETGRAHALCSRFQPLSVRQPHLKDNNGKPIRVVVPSLYGVVSSLANPKIIQKLNEKSIPISTD
jgi:serine protease Do